jgi:hypothetical protein
MRKCIAIVGLFIFLFSGCATAPKPRTIVNAFDYQNDYDAVWSATVETFAELNLPIDNMEKDSGLITTDWIDFTGSGNEAYCDCGGLGLAIENSRQGKFNVFVKQAGTGSSVKVNCMYQQTASLGDTRANRNCLSTGGLEARIAESIREKLK